MQSPLADAPGQAPSKQDRSCAAPAPRLAMEAPHDVGIVLSGRIVLEMEDGTTAELSAGQAFAQQGTPHHWRNPYPVDAVIAVVTMGRDQ
ncbi:cupin domain-containing protein [Streptomyces sp. NPDC058470]|uniref:cupin domain-containing protein n=1 Tax=Streptomyces sp. NPDC058470 TaxID=3346515 RepID=UPI003651A0BD